MAETPITIEIEPLDTAPELWHLVQSGPDRYTFEHDFPSFLEADQYAIIVRELCRGVRRACIVTYR